MAAAQDKTIAAEGRSGIQILLEAETRAAQIIEEAKKEKIKLLKLAKANADKEIEEFKARQEAQLRSQGQEATGSNAAFDTRLEANAARIRDSLAGCVADNSDRLAAFLIANALEVQLKDHKARKH